MYDDIDLYWLLKGKGSFPKKEHKIETPILSSPSLPFPEENNNSNNEITNNKVVKSIQRIIVFYNDGTFEEYKK